MGAYVRGDLPLDGSGFDDGYAGFGAWYDSLSFDRKILADWARRADSSLPADDAACIARIARTPEQGGGFVAGGLRMCFSNRSGGQTEPMRAESVPCPSGSGGVAGEQVREATVEEIRAINAANDARRAEEERRRREELAREEGVRRVEAHGFVVDASGAPVVGASVSIGSVESATDASGAFAMDVVPGVTYNVAVRASGFFDRQVGRAVVGYGVPYNVGRIVIVRTGARPEEEDEFKTGNGDVAKPWYKKPWVWAIVGGVVVVGGVAVAASWRRH